MLLDCGEGLHSVSFRNSADISDRAWSGRYIFDQGRFGIERFGHSVLAREYFLAPSRAKFLRTSADMVFQKDFVRWSTPQSHRDGTGAVSESGLRSQEDIAQIGISDFRNPYPSVGDQHDILSIRPARIREKA